MLRHSYAAPKANGWLDTEYAQELLAWAEVIVWHVGVVSEDNFDWGHSDDRITRDIHECSHVGDWFSKKPAVFWLNGSKGLRKHADYYKERFADIPLVATTPDLCAMFEAKWMPVCMPEWLDKGDYSRSRLKPEEFLHVFHASTNRTLKNSVMLEEAIQPITGKVAGHFISFWPYKRALAFKAACDVTFDHVSGYYGASSVEASALGQPVLVHLDAVGRDHFEKLVGSIPPWTDVTSAKEIRDALLWLANDRNAVVEIGKTTRAWYERSFGNAWKAQRWVGWLEKTL